MKKNTEKTVLKQDEKFLQGINLVTGRKIDYARNNISETQMNSLCINQKLTNIQKFLHIITHGQKIQRWSILENIMNYINNQISAQKVFFTLEKNYTQLQDYLAIMGEAFLTYLTACLYQKSMINKKIYQCLHRLTLRTITQTKNHGSQINTDWLKSLSIFFKLSSNLQTKEEKDQKIAQYKQFINGSFSMNTLPQRRKTALQLIDALLEQSQQIYKNANSKIVFFNKDLNPSTRLVICCIIEKILKVEENQQLWKCISEYYFTDKSPIIRQKSLQIMSEIYYKSNAELLIYELDVEQPMKLQIIIKYATKIYRNFLKQIKSDLVYQVKTISFINRLLKKNQQVNTGVALSCFKILCQNMKQSKLIEQIDFKQFKLEDVNVLSQLILFHQNISNLQLAQNIKNQIFKGLRYHQYNLKFNSQTILSLFNMLDLQIQQQISIFSYIFNKDIQCSRWKNASIFLQKINQSKFNQIGYQKIINCITKIYTSCPYYLIQNIHRTIFTIILQDRKNMDIYIKIREKMMGSKCWMHRRNFIKLYAYCKINGSFQINKLMTPLVYKNILNQKNTLIKIQFINAFISAYQFLDPNLIQQKILIKQTFIKFSQDKDKDLSQMAKQGLEIIKIHDKNQQAINKAITRNTQLYNQQMKIEQIKNQLKKQVKTQKILSIKQKAERQKIKKGTMIQVKNMSNIFKYGVALEKKISATQTKQLVRSNSSQPKKDLLKPIIPRKSKI